jgi:hypothetical protein
MNASGTLFMSQTRPLAHTAADGTFGLTLLAFDRIGVHQVEPWRITWSGPDALDFWQHSGERLKAGQPLHVDLKRIRCFRSAASGPEFLASVILMYLAPTAQSARAEVLSTT